MKDKLFMVEKVGYYDNKYFYWAKDEGEALDIHEAQTGGGEDWVASQVFANNPEKENRGLVNRQNEREAYNSGWQDGYRDATDELTIQINQKIKEINKYMRGRI